MQCVAVQAKDLTQKPPRSPRIRMRGFAILSRAIDKCRAEIAGTAGEYIFGCPVDHLLFAFKGIVLEEFRDLVASGASDREIGNRILTVGIMRTKSEIIRWSDTVSRRSHLIDPAEEEWFNKECVRLDLDPETTTLFEYLEADDRDMFEM